MNADEIVNILREIADVYEQMGVDQLQRGTMRDAADCIESLQAQLAESQRREKAAVGDMKLIVDAVREEYCDETCCFACAFDCDTSINDSGAPNCECPGFERDDCFEWRGPQEGTMMRCCDCEYSGDCPMKQNDNVGFARCLVRLQDKYDSVEEQLKDTWDCLLEAIGDESATGSISRERILKICAAEREGRLRIERAVCRRCEGRGWIMVHEITGGTEGIRNETCPLCHGTGEAAEAKEGVE